MTTAKSSMITWGAISWLISLQFFIIQFVVQLAWATPYSLLHNYISDLGNTACSDFSTNSPLYICSPLHSLMNASFILLGITLPLGAFLTHHFFPPGRSRSIGLALVGSAGLGLILVGFAPENVNIGVHATGAALQFIAGNVGMIIIGALLYQRHHTQLGRFSVVWGLVGLIGLVVFMVCRISNSSLGLGVGGWERVVVYPLPVWAIVMGVIMLREKSG